MRPPSLRLIAWIAAAVVLILAVGAVAGFLSDPFGLKSWWAARRQAGHAEAVDDSLARGLESAGNAEQVANIETHYRREVVIRDLTAQAVNEARSAPDADDPLGPRGDRLRAADQRLCDAYPRSARPPRLALPEAARAPCVLPTLADAPTLADLEAAYLARGQALALCEAAPSINQQTLEAERGLVDAWMEGRAPKPKWVFWRW